MRRLGMIFGSFLAAIAGIGAAFLLAGQARAGGQGTVPCDVTVTISDVCTTGLTTTTAGTTIGTTTVTTTTTQTTTGETTTTESTTTVTTTTTAHHHRHRPPHRHPPRQHAKPHKPKPVPPPPPPFMLPHVSPPLHGGPYVFPVYGPVSFGDGYGGILVGRLSWDHGTDIFAPLGAPVVAVARGTVFQVGWSPSGGNRLWLRDRAGDFFYYANMSAFSSLALSGARVSAGTVLGFVGNTGSARGAPYHLHFEVHPAGLLSTGYDSSAVDPTAYLTAWKKGEYRRLSSVAERFRIPAAAAQPVVRRVVDTAGAVLVQANDISRSSGLSPHSFRTMLSMPVPKVKVQAKVVRQTRVEPVFASGPAVKSWAREALMLDLGVETSGRTTVWDRVAQCESSGNWQENTGNGFYGGLQFTEGTWLEYGGGRFAHFAYMATREQQIVVARRVLAGAGWRAWPACSLKLGLRH